jgi:hypothetical protein
MHDFLPNRHRYFRTSSFGALLTSSLWLATGRLAYAQSTPIAIVPVQGVTVAGALEIADGKAVIAGSGSVTAGEHAATIMLPHRGNLRICPTTKISLTADSSVGTSAATNPASLQTPAESPGLMMALDRGALEAGFATGKNSDVILTPDFRIVISGPGTASVQVRLGEKGDTCVDNRGANAPYVTVSSIFDGGVYRVQPDQRVMFQHGSLHEVVDQEKESCGCPPELPPTSTAAAPANAFPVAQSEGLAPLPAPPPNANKPGVVNAQATAQLSYAGDKPEEAKATVQIATPVAAAPAPGPTPKPEAKRGFFGSIGHFFRTLFGG